ncbi:MAG: aryl-sulfate sulfotransferase [Candidatus Heimdallarchaeaceae archaeon]
MTSIKRIVNKKTIEVIGLLLLIIFLKTPISYSSGIQIQKSKDSKKMLNFPNNKNLFYQEKVGGDRIKKKALFVNNYNPAIYKDNGYFDGFNLFVLENRSLSQDYNTTSFFLIVDMDGKIIREKEFNVSHISRSPAEFINSTTILYSEPFKVSFFNFYTNKTTVFLISGHHEYEYNPINNTIFTFESYEIIINKTNYLFDKIVEYDLSGQEIWQLDTRTFISYNQWCPYHDTYGNVNDITHSNTIFFDTEENMIYYNSRNTNTFFKINHETKDIIWGLGEHGNFTLYDLNGVKKNNIFYHAHAIEKIDNSKFILFDNDYHNQTNLFNERSRIIEISINETTFTANETWTWQALMIIILLSMETLIDSQIRID